MKTEYEPFDVAADYLVSEERIAGYLSAAAEDEDPNVLLLALCDAAKARGMMQVAKAAGLNRESLYKALKPGAHPRFETVQAVLRALGVKLTLSARAGEAGEKQADDAAGEDPLSDSREDILAHVSARLTSMVMQDEKFLASLPTPPSLEAIKALKAAGKAGLALVDKGKPVGKARTRRGGRPKGGGAARRA